MDIGEVIQRSELPASTLRFCEDKTLITPVGRNGLCRIYDPDVLDRLALIALGRNARQQATLNVTSFSGYFQLP